MQLFGTLVAALAIANSALAGVYITSPIATTTGNGGQVLTVQWADDGKTPTVASVGPCSIDLYTGSVNNQVQLQNLAASVDVSKASSVSATIDPTAGQSGGYYFVRFRSLSLKDATNPQYPYQAYSAKFTLNGMSGNFNSSVFAAISADPSAASTASSATAAVGAVSATAKSAGSSATVSTAASATASKSAALPQLAAPGLMAALVGIAGYIAL